MLDEIYEEFSLDHDIEKQVEGRIKFYKYPEVASLSKPHIIIDPVDVPIPADYADDTWLTDDYIFQIEVWSKKRKDTENLAHRIRLVMWDLGFHQGSGTSEYDADYGIFRDARRYEGKKYRENLNRL